jgi:hypothetical protein
MWDSCVPKEEGCEVEGGRQQRRALLLARAESTSGAGVWESARLQTLNEVSLIRVCCEPARLMVSVWLMRPGDRQRPASLALPVPRSHPANRQRPVKAASMWRMFDVDVGVVVIVVV